MKCLNHNVNGQSTLKTCYVKARPQRPHILYDSFYMKYLELANPETENGLVAARGWEVGRMEDECLIGSGVMTRRWS